MTEQIDMINHPQHYEVNRFTCEPADLTTMLPHPIASAVEYILRAPYKGTERQDLEKAKWWLERAQNTKEFWDGKDQLRAEYLRPWGYVTFMAAIFAMSTKSPLVRVLFDDGSISLFNIRLALAAIEHHITESLAPVPGDFTVVGK